MGDADFLADRQRHDAIVLNDLFDPTLHMESHRPFEFACALVRAGGLELGGFDPWYESKAIIDDLRNLALLDLPSDRFPDLPKTRIRLALLAYCTDGPTLHAGRQPSAPQVENAAAWRSSSTKKTGRRGRVDYQ
jgi:hypothetical protein